MIYTGLLQSSIVIMVDYVDIYTLHGIGDGCDVKHAYCNHG